jgi:hypothetical protein
MQLLDEMQIDSLKQFYYEHTHDTNQSFHVTLDQSDPNKIREISNRIEQELASSLEQHFVNFQVFTSSYVVKEPGKKNIVPPHQDWSFVDESINYSVTCWTPLIDVNTKNGALAVISGSHRLFTSPRSSPSPESKSILSDHVFTLFPYVECIHLKAGETLVFDNRLIHASTPNLTEYSRIAVGIGLTNKNAALKHYYENPENGEKEIMEYDINRDFFYTWNNKKLSDLYGDKNVIKDYTCTKKAPKKKEHYSKAEMENKILSISGATYNKDLMTHLSSLFDYDLNSADIKSVENRDLPTARNLENTQTPDFFKTYTPLNILKEIKWRLQGKPQ